MTLPNLTAEILKSFREKFPHQLIENYLNGLPIVDQRAYVESFLASSISKVLSAAREGTRVEVPHVDFKLLDDPNDYYYAGKQDGQEAALAEVSKRWDTLITNEKEI